jgi:CRISPR-associated protein (TIGR03986 family)
MEFHNPYHFIPVKKNQRKDDLSREAFAGEVNADTHRHVTHDRYVADAFSGRLICRLTTETALVVGAKQNEKIPAEVSQYQLDGLPAIPASTLRGLISSLTEAATNSSLRVLEDESYSFRRRMEESLSAIGMIVEEAGALRMRPLALPMLRGDEGKSVKLPLEYRGLFKVPNLKVYIGDKTAIRKDLYPKKNKTFTTATKGQRYYYLQLLDRSWKNGDELDYDRGQYWKRGSLLAQYTRIPNDEPLTQEQVPANERDKYRRGIVRVLGVAERKDVPDTKKHEVFIPYPTAAEQWPTIEILPEAIERFHLLADLRTEARKIGEPQLPYHPIATIRNFKPEGKDDRKFRLKDGDLVFFRPSLLAGSNKSVVVELSLSSIWRGLIPDELSSKPATTHSFFEAVDPELLPANIAKRKFITLAEQMFGFVDEVSKKPSDVSEALLNEDDGAKQLGLAGRIYPSPARFAGVRKEGGWESISSPESLYLNDPDDPEGWTMLKILSAPKPPSPALYFKSTGNEPAYIAKNTLNPKLHVPQGRKFYLHHKVSDGTNPWQTKRRDDVETYKQKVKVRPVRENTVFYFHLDFDNLSANELGALLYALRPTETFRHKLGMGKPIGLGTVRITPAGLLLVNRNERYSADGLFNPRFAAVWHADDSQAWPWPTKHKESSEQLSEASEWPERYAREVAAAQSATDKISPPDLYQNFVTSMDQSLHGALALIGDPSAIRKTVHYPIVEGQSVEAEGETFKWFMANDFKSGRSPDQTAPAKTSLKPLVAQVQGKPKKSRQVSGLNALADKFKSIGYSTSSSEEQEPQESALTELPTLRVLPYKD